MKPATTVLGRSQKIKNFCFKKREERVIQQILRIEALETRLLLSGIGTGLNQKKVVFIDAAGDQVTVQVAGNAQGNPVPTFDILLNGGAADHANIKSIVVHGDAATVLSVAVTPEMQLAANPAAHNSLPLTPGFTAIGSITNTGITPTIVGGVTTGWSASTGLAGINVTNAVVDNINLVGNLGSLTDDISGSNFNGLTPNEISQIHFGNINISGDIGSLTLQGVTTTPTIIHSNNLTGIITVSGTISNLTAPNANVEAPINANAIGNLQVQNVDASITATTSISTMVANILSVPVYSGVGDLTITVGNTANIVAGGNVHLTTSPGDFWGTIDAVGNITGPNNGELVFYGNVAPSTVLHSIAGNIGDVTVIGGSLLGTIVADNGSIGNITVASSGNTIHGLIHAAGAIGNITASGTSSIYASKITTNHGSIGTIVADNITGTWVDAETGNIAYVLAHSSYAAGGARYLSGAEVEG